LPFAYVDLSFIGKSTWFQNIFEIPC
jgi:hypothetical protein